MKQNYRTPTARGRNMLAANPQRLENADGSRWATGRNVKGESSVPRCYVAVEVWALKERGADGRAVTVDTHRSREDAVAWCGGGVAQ